MQCDTALLHNSFCTPSISLSPAILNIIVWPLCLLGVDLVVLLGDKLVFLRLGR
jgi:hypothetical protein